MKKNCSKFDILYFTGNRYARYCIVAIEEFAFCYSNMDFVCEHNVARNKACFSCYWKVSFTAEKPIPTRLEQGNKSGAKVKIPKTTRAKQLEKSKIKKPSSSGLGCQIKRLSKSRQENVKIAKETNQEKKSSKD